MSDKGEREIGVEMPGTSYMSGKSRKGDDATNILERMKIDRCNQQVDDCHDNCGVHVVLI